MPTPPIKLHDFQDRVMPLLGAIEKRQIKRLYKTRVIWFSIGGLFGMCVTIIFLTILGMP